MLNEFDKIRIREIKRKQKEIAKMLEQEELEKSITIEELNEILNKGYSMIKEVEHYIELSNSRNTKRNI